MRQIAWQEIPGKLDEAWRRFRALSWRWKAPALSLAALCALGVALLVVAVAGGGGGDAGPAGGPGARHGRAAFDLTPTPGAAPPTATASAVPTPTAAPTPAATPVPPPTPVAGAYEPTPALPSANFDRMLGFAVIPGSTTHAVVVTQGGVIRRVPLNGGGAAPVYGDLSSRVIDYNAESEGGLLGLAFSPNFSKDRRVYLYFTSNDCPVNGYNRCDVLARYNVAGNDIDEGSEVVLLEIDDFAPNHNGGQILFGPDGYLYVGLGDGGSAGDPQENAQNTNRLLGKVLRLDVSGATYSAPPDNPFVNRPGSDFVFAYGFRNPWRFSFDRQTGAMWVGDVGQNSWEEVDRVVKGGNHGWDCYEGFASYEPSGCAASGFVAPRAAYSHDEGCSVTGGYVYRGPSMPELDGWYVYADFCSGRIWAVNTAGGAPPVLLADTGLPIASFSELPNGELLVLTFANAVYRLAR